MVVTLSLLFIGVAVITALLYFFCTPDPLKTRYVTMRVTLAAFAGVITCLFMYFEQYPMTPFNLLLWFAANSMVALMLNSSLAERKSTLLLAVFGLAGIGFCWIVVITLLSAATASQLAAAPAVTTMNGPSDVINSSHIRLVSIETARWRSDKVIGSLGYKAEIADPDIQMLNGTLAWITPLDFSGPIKAWSYSDEGTGGYVIVNAEDPKAEAQMILVPHMIYTRQALFGNNANRRIWEEHPEWMQMESTFQLDDRHQPEYVVQLAEPMLYGCIGERPVGVATVSPVNGDVRFYRLGEEPAWVQRVWSETTTEEWIGWWGRYQLGWWNSFIEQRDVKVLGSEDVFLINGNDGNLYWFGTMSNPGTDSSMVGYMLTNVKTGTFTFYMTPGYYNDLGAQNNVLQNPEVAKAPELEVVQPIMYIIDGQEIWIIPVITPSGEQTLVGLVEARTGATYIAPTLQNVLAQWHGDTVLPGTTLPKEGDLSVKEKIAQIRKLLDEIEAEAEPES
jgi:hypothetical protein